MVANKKIELAKVSHVYIGKNEKALLREAAEQNKTVIAHAQHLIVHGVLHAQGYDHLDDDEADEMEALEAEMLATLGIANPYQEQ